MDGLPAVRAAPDVRSGYFAGDVFEQVDGGPLQICNDLRRRSAFGFFLRVRPAHQARRNDETQGFRADARSVGDDKIAKAEKRFVLLPHGDVQERVGTDYEEDAVAVVNMTEVAHGINRIVELRAAEVFTGFGKRRNEVRMIAARQRDHSETVRKGSEVLLQFMGRPAGRNEMDFVEIEAAVRSAREAQMTAMNGIERAAEESDATRLMFCGGAMRLGYGQCASPESTVSPDGIGVRNGLCNFLMNL